MAVEIGVAETRIEEEDVTIAMVGMLVEVEVGNFWEGEVVFVVGDTFEDPELEEDAVLEDTLLEVEATPEDITPDEEFVVLLALELPPEVMEAEDPVGMDVKEEVSLLVVRFELSPVVATKTVDVSEVVTGLVVRVEFNPAVADVPPAVTFTDLLNVPFMNEAEVTEAIPVEIEVPVVTGPEFEAAKVELEYPELPDGDKVPRAVVLRTADNAAEGVGGKAVTITYVVLVTLSVTVMMLVLFVGQYDEVVVL